MGLDYMIKDCHEIPNQNIKTIKPPYVSNSLDVRSCGISLSKWTEDPNNVLTQLRKKKVGASKYNKIINIRQSPGYRSKKKLKKSISDTNIIEPGKPKNTNKLSRLIKNNLGVKKFTPLISVINLVLNRRPIASTSKKEFVESNAWLINIQKLASIKDDCPLTTQMVSQCISTTVE